MGRPKQAPLPPEANETLAKFEAWRRTRKSGERIPGDLWSEATALARRLGVNRVSLSLGLSHTTLKEHVEKGRVATRPTPQARPGRGQPSFVEMPQGGFLGVGPSSAHTAGLELEVIRLEGDRMLLRWPAGSVVDPSGMVATFLGRAR